MEQGLFKFTGNKQYKGRLPISGNRGGNFEIDDWSESGALVMIPKITATNLENGYKYLFKRSYNLNSKTMYLDRLLRKTRKITYFEPELTIEGKEDKPTDVVNELTCTFPLLQFWLGCRLISNKQRGEITITDSVTKEYSWKQFELKFYVFVHESTFGLEGDFSLKHIGMLTIKTKNKKNIRIETFLETYRSIERLVSLGYQYPLRNTEFQARSTEYKPATGKVKTYGSMSVNITSVKQSEKKYFDFDYILANNDFQKIVDKWLKNEKDLEKVVNFYFASMNNDGAYLESRFLYLVNAVDVIYSIVFGNYPFTKVSYTRSWKKYKELLDSSELEKEFSEKMIRLTSNGNEFSILEKFKTLHKYLEENSVRSLENYDIPKIVRTRVFYSHHTSTQNIYNVDELGSLVRALQDFTKKLLFVHLGIKSY